MTKPRDKKPPVQGTVEFIQHVLPGLDPGSYMLTVSQTVSTQTAHPGNTYYFAVQSPRASLSPADLFATYPPDMAVGEFDNTFPHVVLTNRSLPWQRYPTLDEPPREFPDHQHDRDVPSWLAVLLFDAQDETDHPGFRAQARAGKTRDLFIRRDDNPNQVYSYFYAKKDLDRDSTGIEEYLDYGEEPDDPCQIIDIPLALFWKIAPSVDDLKMTAHLRNVNIVRKATQNGVPAGRNDLSRIPGTSDFAVVLGSRVPRENVRSFAHLVSLEGLEAFLPGDPAQSDRPGEVAAPNKIEGADTFTISPGGSIRLVSLASWSFTSIGDSRHFEQLLLALKPKRTDATGATDFAIGVPFPEAKGTDSREATLARKALQMGYTALQHQTRDGGQTVSWYRGPLLPYHVATNVLPDVLTSADAATIYNPQTGMFDIGYAGAWQIGRLLALQDRRFSTLLSGWRGTNMRDAVARMEALVLQQSLDDIQAQLRDEQLIYPLLAAFAPPGASAPKGTNAGALVGGRADRAAAHRAALTDAPTLTAVLQDQLSVPHEIYTWLARLKLLEGVPFSYLVPDERMLPPESIRFFHLDMNWVDALIDGAVSIGRHGAVAASPEATHDHAVKALVRAKASGHARTRRPMAMGLAAPDPQPLETVSGFLLRSDVVKGWPGLEVNGYDKDGNLLDIVRFERLAPTVLLCLFEKGGNTVSEVDIHEPAEGLHFGLSGGTSVNIRDNQGAGTVGPGSQVKDLYQPAPFRDTGTDGPGVVRMFRLARALHDPKYAGHIQGIYQGFDHLPSSQFAMQMLRGVGMVAFGVDGSAS
jgi:hypothetical protein